MSSPCPEPEQLRAFVLGKLPEEASDAIAAHLDHCPACESTISGMDRMNDTLVSQLCVPAAQSKYIEEPQCREALQRVKAMAGAAVAPEPSGITVAVAPGGGGGEPDGGLGRLGEYELLAKLGEGGMGAVYKARQTRLDKIVAIKVLPKHRMADPQARARFEREMRAVGRVSHPNIIQALDARDIEGTTVLVMEYAKGLDLGEVVHRCARLGVADACSIVHQAALGLEAVHENGLVHRDIKPSNLMLTTLPSPVLGRGAGGEGVPGYGSATIKILDLGLARLGTELPGSGELTSEGQAMGTADYMAPEQVTDSHTVDIRADIYSLGCTLYKLLAGHAPFSGPDYDNAMKKMIANTQQPVPPLGQMRSDVPKTLLKVLDRMLAKKPDERFATPAEVAAAIAPFAKGADLPRLLKEAEEAGYAAAKGDRAPPATEPHASSGVVGTDPDREKGEGEKGRRGEGEKGSRGRALLPSPVLGRGAGSEGRWYLPWIAAGVALVLVGGGIWFLTTMIRVRDKDGNIVAEVKVPEGGKAEIVGDGGDSGSAKGHPLAGQHGNDSEISNPKSQIRDLKSPLPSPADAFWQPGPAENVLPGLVARPAKLPGIGRWQLETVAPSGPFVCGARWSPDGKLLALGDGNRIRVLDGSGRRVVQILTGHTGPVTCVGFSPDGKLLASAAADKTVRLWDFQRGATIKVIDGGPRPANLLAWSPDGRLLAATSVNYDPPVRLWNADGTPGAVCSGSPVPTYKLSLSWSPDSKWIAAGGGALWSADGKPGPKIDPDGSTYQSAFSPGGQWLAIHRWPAGGTVLGLIDTKTWKVDPSIVLPDGYGFLWRPDGRQLLVQGPGGINLWDFDANFRPKAQPRRYLHRDWMWSHNQWSPDGTTIVLTRPEYVALWNAASGALVREITPSVALSQVQRSADGKWLASVAQESADVQLWTADGRFGPTLKGHAGKVTAIAWSRKGNRLASTADDGTVRIWQPEGGPVLVLKTQTQKNTSLAWSPDAARLVCGGEGSAELWRLADPRKSKLLAMPSPPAPLPSTGEGSHFGPVEQIIWRPDGKLFATRSYDDKDKTRFVLVWDGEGNSVPSPKIQATDIQWGPDGKSLLICNLDKNIRAWHGGEDEPTADWEVEGEKVVRADWSLDGKWLSSDSEDGSVRLWCADELPKTILKAAVRDHGCRFWSPDSHWLAVIMPDESIQLWDLVQVKAGAALRGHGGAVTGISWEADGRGLVSCSTDGTLRRWDVPSGEPLWTLATLPRGRAARIDQGGKLELSDPRAEDELRYVVEQSGGELKDYTPAEFRQLAQSLGWAEKAGFAQGLAADLAADEEKRKAEDKKREAEKRLADDSQWTPWQDLFDGQTLDGWRHVIEGEFGNATAEVHDGQIVLENTEKGEKGAAIVATRPMPTTDYEVALEAMRITGGDFGTMTFPIGDRACTFYLGGGETVDTVGLGDLDGLGFENNETTSTIEFQANRWYKVRLRVTAEQICAWIDAARVINVGVADHEFGTLHPNLARFGLYAWNGKAAIRAIRIRQLKASRTTPHPGPLPEGEEDQAKLPDGTKQPQKLLELLKPGQWVSLFDGKTLAGWERVERKDDPSAPKVRVEEGRVVFSGAPSGLAWNGPLPRVDYELAFDVDKLANERSVFRPWLPATEGSLSQSYANYFDGLLVYSGDARGPWFANHGRYHHVEMRVTKGRGRIWVDGRHATDLLPGEPAQPNLGFSDEWGPIAIKNIRLRRILPKDADAPPVHAQPRTYQAAQPLPPPKVEPLEIRAQGFEVRQGIPLSPTALVVKPAAIDGAYAWSIETAAHRGAVAALAFSPDGRQLASGGQDGIVRIWDAGRCKLVRMFSGLGAGIATVTWSPDGRYLAVADEHGGTSGGGVRIFDPRTALLLRRIDCGQGPAGSLAWSPDGRTLACAGDQGVYAYDFATMNRMAASEPKRLSSLSSTALAWSADGRLLATSPRGLSTFSVPSGKATRRFASGRVDDLAWSPDGRAFAAVAGGYDQVAVLRVRDAASGEYLGGFACPIGLNVPFWSPDGKKILLSGGGALFAWDTSSRQLTELAGGLDMSAVACSSDMRQVAVGKGDGSIAVWQCDALEKGVLSNARLIPGHTPRAEPAGFSPDGTRLVVASKPAGKLIGRLYNTDSDQCLDEWEEEGWNKVAYFAPPLADWAGDGACFSYSFNNTVTMRSPKRVMRTPDIEYQKAAWSHDGRMLAAWRAGDKAVWLIQRSTQKVVRKISDVPSIGLAWSPDDKTLAVSCGPELKVKLIPMDEKAPVRSLEDPQGHKEGNCDMRWSPDGKTLAAIAYPGQLKVWDLASGKVRMLAGAPVWDRDLLRWLDEGKTLVTYAWRAPPDDGVVVWDVANGKRLRTFGTDGEWSISFAPRKGLFAVAGPGAIRLRSLADGEMLRTLAFLRNKRLLSVSPEGHWRGSPGVEPELRYLVLTDTGQDMLTPEEFEKKYGWKNDPSKVLPKAD